MPMDLTDVVRVDIAFATAPWAATPTWVDVTSRLRRATWEWVGAIHGSQAGESKATLDFSNTDAYFDQGNSGSAVASNLRRNLLCRIVVSNDAFTTEVTHYTGYLQQLMTVSDGEYQDNAARLGLTDGIGILGRYPLEDFAAEVEFPGDRIVGVLDEISWPAAFRGTIRDGTVRLIRARERDGNLINQSALAHINEVNQSELGAFWCDGAGDLHFADRFKQLEQTEWNTSQITLGDGVLAAAPIEAGLGGFEHVERVTAWAASGATSVYENPTTNFPPESADQPMPWAKYDADAEAGAQHGQEAAEYAGQRPGPVECRVWPNKTTTVLDGLADVAPNIDRYHRSLIQWQPRGSDDAIDFPGTIIGWRQSIDRIKGWTCSIDTIPYDTTWTTAAADFYEWGTATTASSIPGY